MFDDANAAKELSKLGAAKGGKARAKALSKEELSAIGRNAAEKRWERAGKAPLRIATHPGELTIGNLTLPCAVLEDGTRVLSETGVVNALGLYRSGAVWVRARKDQSSPLPLFVANKNIRPFVDAELEAILTSPIWFRGTDGNRSRGIPAVTLPRICNVWLKARDEGVLSGSRQEIVAARADILMRGLAEVGIVALVDEATGFQDDRDRQALAKILEAFIETELRRWVKTFPVEYYKEMYRLRELPYPPKNNKMPQYFGVLTNDVVYKRLAPAVLDELKRVNPANEKGHRPAKHHQWLTQDVGHPKLLQHLGAVVATMKMSTTWDEFIKTLDKHYPKQPRMPLFEQQDSASDSSCDLASPDPKSSPRS